MPFALYPCHEDACAHVGHCPHLAGAAWATVVLAANDNQLHLDMLHAKLHVALQSVTGLRALALFWRNDIGVSYLQVPRTLQELFDFPFTRPRPSGHAAAADRETPPRVARVPG